MPRLAGRQAALWAAVLMSEIQGRSLMSLCETNMKAAIFLSIAVVTIWLQLGCTGCHDEPDALGTSPSNGTGVVNALKQHEKQIIDAKDAKSEAEAMRGLQAWIRGYQAKHTSPQHGSELGFGLRVTEQETGRDVTLNIPGSDGPVQAELIFDRNVTGEYERLYTMRFVPKDKSNLMLLMQE